MTQHRSLAPVAILPGLLREAVRKRLERARRTLREDVVSRLGLGLHEARTRAVTGILALLGTPPTDPQALLLTAGLGTAALPPAAAVGGAAIGVAGSVAGLWSVSRRLDDKVRRRLLGVGTLVTLALVAMLPLPLPRLVWLRFLVAQGGVAVLMFHALPRHGIRPTRWAALAGLLAAAAGAVAIVWAMGRMS